jgi:hypothetical protein
MRLSLGRIRLERLPKAPALRFVRELLYVRCRARTGVSRRPSSTHCGADRACLGKVDHPTSERPSPGRPCLLGFAWARVTGWHHLSQRSESPTEASCHRNQEALELPAHFGGPGFFACRACRRLETPGPRPPRARAAHVGFVSGSGRGRVSSRDIRVRYDRFARLDRDDIAAADTALANGSEPTRLEQQRTAPGQS